MIIMVAAIVGSYFAFQEFRIPVETILPIVIIFLILTGAITILIIFEGLKEEETRDSYKMADLHN